MKESEGAFMWTRGLMMICVTVALQADHARAGELTPRTAVEVRPVGRTAERIRAAWDRLCSPPLSDVDFVLSDVSFQLNRRFNEYSGDISGRMIGAMVAAQAALGVEPAMLRPLLARIGDYQKADGHFGAEQNLAEQIIQSRDMPILWGNGRLLYGLALYCRANPDPRLLTVARRLGDYLCATRPYYGRPENFQEVGGLYASGFTTCYPSLVDGLALLGEISGEARYLEEAAFIARLSLLDREFDHHHSHGRLTTWRGMLEIDRIRGNGEFLPVVHEGCERIAREYLLPTGGVTEVFDLNHAVDEGCSEADWIWVNLMLWRATGDSRCLDRAENALNNHLLATQYFNGGFGHRRLCPLRHGELVCPAGAIGADGAEAYWCCSKHGTHLLLDLPGYAILGDASNAWITWLAEAEALLGERERPLRVAVRRQGPAIWGVQLQADTPTTVTLRLRVPGWADGRIRVDGRTVDVHHGWAQIRREFSGSDTLLVELPGELRIVGGVGEQHDPAASVHRICVGPDLYCLPEIQLAEGLLAPEELPGIALSRTPPAGEVLPAVVENAAGRRQQVTLIPMRECRRGARRYVFRALSLEPGEFAARHAAAEPPPTHLPVTVTLAVDGRAEIHLRGKHWLTYPYWQQAVILEGFAPPGPTVIAMKIGSESARPGLICRVTLPGGDHFSGPDEWTASECPDPLPADALTRPDLDRYRRIPLADLGPWGSPPWKHMPGALMNTPARWIWPAVDRPGAHYLLWSNIELKPIP